MDKPTNGPPPSPYAPMRLREEVWWQYGRDAALHGMVAADGQMSPSLPARIQADLIEPMARQSKEFLQTVPQSDRGTFVVQMIAKLAQLRHWIPLIGQYELNGRQIFDLHDQLTEALLNTDVGDCCLDGLQLPYDCFYLAFGRQPEIRVPWEDSFEYADGAFIAVTPWDAGAGVQKRRFKIGICTVKDSGEGVMMPGYFLDFTPDEAALPVQAAVDTAIERRKASFREGADENDPIAVARIAELDEGAALARKALLLVFNAMFYLESLGELPPESVGRDVPPALTAKWIASKPDRRHKIKSALTAQGYSVVRLVGTEVANSFGLDKAKLAGVRTHWRRGFFRMQACGPDLTMRRRLWIRPTVVNASKSDIVESPGHVYIAGDAVRH